MVYSFWPDYVGHSDRLFDWRFLIASRTMDKEAGCGRISDYGYDTTP